jgi:hypothetical protein
MTLAEGRLTGQKAIPTDIAIESRFIRPPGLRVVKPNKEASGGYDMRKTLILLCLAAAGLCPAQQIGLSLGNAMFPPASADAAGEILVPKLFMAGLRIPLGRDLWINVSGGYGYECSELKYRDSSQESRTTGIPLDLEFQVLKPLVLLSGIRAGLGMGLAYYPFDSRIGHNGEPEETETKREFSGTVQYVSFGLDLQISRRLSAILQVKKPMLSWLTEEFPDYPEKETLVFGSGFDDVSVGMGLFLNLRKKSDRSILEIFNNDRDDD